MHLAAKALASQAVPEFMPGHDEQRHEQQHRKGPPLKKSGNVLNHISQISEGDANRAQNRDRGQDEKMRGKEKLDLADQIIEEPVGIEKSESQIEQAALEASCGRLEVFVLITIQQAGR